MNKVKIKLCGMTCEEDIALINRLGVDMAGFVLFFPKSRRNLPIEKAAKLAAGLEDVRAVAVTVSPTPEQVRQIQSAALDYIQIHGELTDETYEACELPIIRAFNDINIGELARSNKLEKIKAYLFDAAEPGSGKRCDWDNVAKLPRAGRSLILAGGLTPENVAAAIEAVRPDMVDVSSGIERPEGGKDPELAERFTKAVKAIEDH